MHLVTTHRGERLHLGEQHRVRRGLHPIEHDHRAGQLLQHRADRCDADAAFTILTRASQNRNIKLRDVARGIVDVVSRPYVG